MCKNLRSSHNETEFLFNLLTFISKAIVQADTDNNRTAFTEQRKFVQSNLKIVIS